MDQRILRLKSVMALVGLSRSSIYNAIARNEFPRQISLGARSVGWLESEIHDWLQRRVAISRGAA